ncbi:MAG: hypothetical protein MSA68_01340 [Helicobacter sp.]|nr:hypothetical protein [Helicobacter sp.]
MRKYAVVLMLELRKINSEKYSIIKFIAHQRGQLKFIRAVAKSLRLADVDLYIIESPICRYSVTEKSFALYL